LPLGPKEEEEKGKLNRGCGKSENKAPRKKSGKKKRDGRENWGTLTGTGTEEFPGGAPNGGEAAHERTRKDRVKNGKNQQEKQQKQHELRSGANRTRAGGMEKGRRKKTVATHDEEGGKQQSTQAKGSGIRMTARWQARIAQSVKTL